ncbi:hypothetical protein [Motiliproteus sediminis]|uniref:hypothetical protein n=1 Tax=Motiliproteus sediminis TaxID=1468178 RepID=UPI001AEFBB60|nr:hypothetical protein [Motiliproteus sediminis]
MGALLTVSGCAFNPKQLAKSDVDLVVDAHIEELRTLVRRLCVKLYKRNPRELAKGGYSLEQRLAQLFDDPGIYYYRELDRKVGNDALLLAFAPDYRGDRVFAFMVGLKTMLHASYGLRTELFMLDRLDQQALYNSARNLETINWRLNNLKSSTGQPYLLSNGFQQGVANLSFERLFGKMIVIQDMMARVVADQNDRAINSVIHSVASTTLLPIGL